MTTSPRSVVRLCCLVLMLMSACAYRDTCTAQSIAEEIEWTWSARPAQTQAPLLNVLLIGDSIARAYYAAVAQRLAGRANVYLFATSASVGDPRLLHQLADFAELHRVQFRVIHFNNGMHGWAYNEDQYRAAFPAFVDAVAAISPRATLIWASTTPVKVESSPGPTNARVEARDALAATLVRARRMPIDDQYALMRQHADRYEDTVHFNAAGADIQATQVVTTVAPWLRP